MRKVQIVLMLCLGILLTGCGKKTMNEIIQSEPHVTGTVKEVYEQSILIECVYLEGYKENVLCSVSLDVENKDSMTHFHKGDRVIVYYDGNIAESYPLQINHVYAIVLIEPVKRVENH